MTVDEHFVFFAMFKGMGLSEAKADSKSLIHKVDLELDYKKMSNQLSGIFPFKFIRGNEKEGQFGHSLDRQAEDYILR